MVKSKEELRYDARGWLKQAAKDLNRRIGWLFDDVNFDELKELLGVNSETLHNILDGKLSGLTAETLIKLFSLNDLALVVVPIDKIQSDGLGLIRNSFDNEDQETDDDEYDSDDFDDDEDADDFDDDEDEAVEREPISFYEPHIPQRDERGRFVSRNQHPSNGRTIEASNANSVEGGITPYHSMPIEGLKSIIRRNIWDSEIDLNRATRNELIDFILDKERIFAERNHLDGGLSSTCNETQRNEAVDNDAQSHTIRQNNDSEDANPFSELIRAMMEASKNNLQLAEQIRKFAPHN